MELKLARRVLKLDLYGEKMEIPFPTTRQYKDYQKIVVDNTKKKDGDKDKQDDFELMAGFLTTLGFNGSLVDDLEPEHLTKIVNTIVGIEEKK